jgi:hypothetical protein
MVYGTLLSSDEYSNALRVTVNQFQFMPKKAKPRYREQPETQAVKGGLDSGH